MHNRSGKRLLETRSQEWPETSKIEQIEPDAVVNYDYDNDTYQKHKLGFRESRAAPCCSYGIQYTCPGQKD
jgi:hypothetical protein